MKRTVVLWMLAFGCGGDRDDKWGTHCDGLCSSALTIALETVPEAFMMTVRADGAWTLEVSCPDGHAYSEGIWLSCEATGVVLEAEGEPLPDTVAVSLNKSAEVIVIPDWTEHEVCSTHCNSALVDF